MTMSEEGMGWRNGSARGVKIGGAEMGGEVQRTRRHKLAKYFTNCENTGMIAWWWGIIKTSKRDLKVF